MLVIKQFGPVTYAMGTLAEILAGTGIPAGTKALPSDVTGCTLQYDGSKWNGFVGIMTASQALALESSGLLNSLNSGSILSKNGTTYEWSGSQSGLVASQADGIHAVAFNFDDTVDGDIPASDALGRPFNLYFPSNTFAASGAVIDGGYARSKDAGLSVDKGFYLDTEKHENDISEAGATINFDSNGITFALVLWKDYASILFPTHVLTTGAHIRFTTTGISYDIWDAGGVIHTLATAALSLSPNVDYNFLVRFSGNIAQVFVNGHLTLTVNDSRINTLGRKVACFEPYQNAGVSGFVRIKSGYAISSIYSEPSNVLIPAASFKQQACSAILNITSSFVTLIGDLRWTRDTAIAIAKFSIVQSVAGDIYVDFLATTPSGVVTHNTVTANRDIRTGIVTVMANVSGINRGTVSVMIAKDGYASASIPVSTYLDTPSIVLIPVANG